VREFKDLILALIAQLFFRNFRVTSLFNGLLQNSDIELLWKNFQFIKLNKRPLSVKLYPRMLNTFFALLCNHLEKGKIWNHETRLDFSSSKIEFDAHIVIVQQNPCDSFYSGVPVHCKTGCKLLWILQAGAKVKVSQFEADFWQKGVF
jgi:hypothetical protein